MKKTNYQNNKHKNVFKRLQGLVKLALACVCKRYNDERSTGSALRALGLSLFCVGRKMLQRLPVVTSSALRALGLSLFVQAEIKLHLKLGSALRALGLSLVWGGAVVVLGVATLATTLIYKSPEIALAAPNAELNFQARLMTASGQLIPDGFYNAEFKIYDDLTAGSLLWTETYYDSNGVTAGNDNRIRVENGYLTANLGSLTAFPGTIDWSEQLFLSINIGGLDQTATPTWDGEMDPRMQITAVPYAFASTVSENVRSTATNTASTNSANVSVTSGNATGATSNSGNVIIDSGTATGTTGAITLGATNASAIQIGRASLLTEIDGSLDVAEDATFNGNLTVTAGNLFTNAGSTLFTAITISNDTDGGVLGGTAAATVDIATSLNVNQTTAGQTFTLASPTTTTSGRILYINNVGSAEFTLEGNPIAAGESSSYIWNGTSWVQTISFTSTGVDTVGVIDSQSKSANGAVISGTNIYLQTADATYPGLVSVGAQTFNGLKTFDDGLIVTTGGATITAGDLAVTGGSISTNGVTRLSNAGALSNITGYSQTSGVFTATLTDNTTDALDIQEGTNNYLNINTTNGSENISFGNTTTNPSYNFLGSGTLAVAGAQTIAGNLTVDTNTLFVDAANNRVAVGTTTTTDGLLTVTGAPVNGQIVNISGTSTATSGVVYGTNSNLTATPGAASTTNYIGSRSVVNSSSTNLDSAWLVGTRGEVNYNGGGTLNVTAGLQATTSFTNASTVVNRYFGILSGAASFSGGATATNYNGIAIGLPSSASTTNQTGLLITNDVFVQPAGDWAIYTATTDASYLGGALTVTGLATINGGLTIEAGDTFTFNSDAFTDFTGGGLTNVGGLLTVDNSSASGFFQQGGNSFGATAVLGTNDSFGLTLEVGGVSALQIADGGAMTIQNETDSTTGFRILDADGGTPVFSADTTNERVGIGTDTPTAKLQVVNTTPADNVLLIRAAASQTAPLALFQDSSGTELFRITTGVASSIYAGSFSGNAVTSGTNNAAFGGNTLRFNTSGSYNSAFGFGALLNNTEAQHNTAVGYAALNQSVTGWNNTAVGSNALLNSTSWNNTAVGEHAGRGQLGVTNGEGNTFIGRQSGYSFTTGDFNVSLGMNTGYSLTEGSGNIFLGYQTGYTTTTGSNNIIIGYDIDASSASASNELNIGGVLQGSTSTLAAQFNGNLTVNDDLFVTGNTGLNNSTAPNLLSVNTLTTADANAQVAISTGGTGNVGMLIQGVAGQTADLLRIESSDGANILIVEDDGAFTLQNTTDSNRAFSVLDDAGAYLLRVDTQNNRVNIGSDNTGNQEGTVLNLNSSNDQNDPTTGAEGDIYYNESLEKFRCNEGGIWRDCVREAALLDAERRQYAQADGATASATFAKTPEEGNLLVAVSFHRQEGTAPTISGSGWTLARNDCYGVVGGGCGTADTGYRRGMAIWYKIAGASEPTNIQTSWSPASDNNLVIQEFQASNGYFVFDDDAGANSGASTTSSQTTGTTAATSAANSLVLTFMGNRETDSIDSWTNGIGDNLSFSSTRSVSVAYKNAEGIATQESTATFNLGGRYTLGAILTFSVLPNQIIVQDGNSFGQLLTIGTNDNYDLNIETNGIARLTVQADGDIAFDGNTLFVDAANNRVGIGTDAPVAGFEVATDIAIASNRTIKFNAYYNGSNDVYLANGSAVQQWQDETNDFYRFYAAAPGLQGDPVSFQEAFSINLNTADLGDVSFDSGVLVVDASSNTVQLNNNVTFAAASGTSGDDITFSDVSFQNCVLTTDASGILTCATSGALITLQGAYTGGNTITTTDNRNIIFSLADTATDSDFIVDILGTGNTFEVRDSGTAVLSVVDGGGITLQNSSDSANAFRVLSSAAGTYTGAQVLGVDTTNFAVDLASTRYQTVINSTCAVDCTITQANVDQNAAIIVEATAGDIEITLPDPTDITAGRLVYITAANGSEDFTLVVNGGGTNNEIAMRENTTATMIWNGADWTAAGASSSTTLQAAYNNTLTSAGGAEIVLNNTATSNGLTVRNNATTPIIGSIFEAQTAIGSNLFSVNNNAVEYANNGGAENTFTGDWSATPAGGTVTRYTTQGDYIATGVGSVQVATTGSGSAGQGAENTLSSALTANLQYSVSFAVRGTSSFSTLDVYYSPDGTTTGEVACTTGETVTQGKWTRIICTFDAPASGITASNAIFIRQSDSNTAARTYYIENLSVTVKADVNHAVDGDVDDAGNFATYWTAFGSSTISRETSIIYNTNGATQVDTTAAAGDGVRNNLAIAPSINTQYLVTFYARSSNTFDDIRVRYSRDGGSNFVSCTDYSTQSVSTASWTRITCLLRTDGTAPSNADLIIDQPTATARTFYVDGLEMTLNENTASNVQIGGGNLGGPTTLFTLDRSAGPPVGANNDAYLGSMYYDTTTGRIQCYESGGWGTCGAPPDNIVNLNPEYAGSVLNGSGIGTMQADVCANESGVLQVNATLCSSGEARSFYTWTSPQATQQTYSIYVTYQLPSTFDGFASDDTVTLTGRVDSTTNAAVTYEMFRSENGSITQCGSGETNVATSANTWQTVGINGNEATGCGFTSSSANAFVIFKLNLKANSNASAYVSTLSFTTTGR